ncbi:MAG: hypothetical protein O3B21_11730 [Proteobacteria bacterium]|nr:hypothetical protein [Pseudomonadota bacterium]MDA1355939.1 hypothetical protein [Pseudomonadota bacterium]
MKHLFSAVVFALLAGNTLSLGAQQITVTPSACQTLTAHTPHDDVAYRPGLDVSGNAVAPADLNAPGQLDFDADHEFRLPIELPLENVLAIAATDTLNIIRDSNIGVGLVTVKNGQAYFNDEPLSGAQSHAIAVECQRRQDATTR